MKYRFLLLIALICLIPSATYADRVENMKDVPDWNDFDLGPTSFPIELKQGQSVTKTLQLTNRTGETADFFVEVEDFEGSQDPSQSITLQGKNTGRYSAKDWTHIEKKQFTLEHGQRQFFDVTITAPEDADAGDHYMSVLVRTAPKDTVVENMSNVRLVSRAGSLFFIRIPGQSIEDGMLTSFSTGKKLYMESPVDMNILFKNNGTVRLTPSGIITVKNMFGKTVEVVDVESFNALRDSVRSFSKQWVISPWKMGRYTATLQLDRGYDGKKDTQTVVFWFIPKKEAIVFTGVFLLFVMLIVVFRKKFHVRIALKK